MGQGDVALCMVNACKLGFPWCWFPSSDPRGSAVPSVTWYLVETGLVGMGLVRTGLVGMGLVGTGLVGTGLVGMELVGRPAEPGPLLPVFTEFVGVESNSEPCVIISECHPDFKFSHPLNQVLDFSYSILNMGNIS